MAVDPVSAVARVSAVPTMLRVITEWTGLRLSLITHVTADSWTCCAVNDALGFGLNPGDHLELATTLCSEVRACERPIVISHASNDPVYRTHHTPRLYKFESYIAVPIFLRDGSYFGNVCALDANPIDLSAPRTVAMFELFAQLVGLQLEAEAQQERTSNDLAQERAQAELREQFIAVLGHDVRAPLNAIAIGTAVLERTELPAVAAQVVTRMKGSVDRISRLVDDVLDFARGRLGGGIPLQATMIDSPRVLFEQVVEELKAMHPERAVSFHVDGDGPMRGDPVRLSQLAQNLVGNALVHSPAGTPVDVRTQLDDGHLVLRVTNRGAPLSAQTTARLFEPFQRGDRSRPVGLGLGLYIASQIVRSHGGTIGVDSSDVATTFTCRIPRAS